MPEETTTTTTTETPTAQPPADLLKEVDTLRKHNADLLNQVKKMKGSAEETVAKALDPIAREARDLKAQISVFRALNAEGLQVKENVSEGVVAAILKGPGVKIGDDGSVEGVSDAIKAYREAGFLGGIPEPAKPESSPQMAKAKSNAAAPDPKFAKVEALSDLMKLGVESFNEFREKYPDRFAALGRKK